MALEVTHNPFTLETMKLTTHQKTLKAGINLRGTCHAGKSAAELRRDNPDLAQRWARFITANKVQLVAEISKKLCVS